MSLLESIQNGNLHIWSTQTSETNINYSHFFSLLDESEALHAQCIKIASSRQTFVVSHGWLRSILGSYLRCHSSELIFAKTSFGKPYLPNYPLLSFNLSHCSDRAMLAVAWNCQLGIDIEVYKPLKGIEDIAKSILSEEEHIYWRTLPDEFKTIFFYDLWTRKEAYFKATGLGITAGLQECVIDPHLLNSFLKLPPPESPDKWRIITFRSWEDASSIVVANKDFPHVKFC